MQFLRLLMALSAAGLCWLLLCALRRHDLRQGEPQAGSCQVVTLERGDGGQPGRSVARRTARCACVPGQMAGATRARPACVRGETVSSSFLAHSKKTDIVLSRQWCRMSPCLDGEGCELLGDRSGWTCTRPGGGVKTTTVRTLGSPLA
ncbi:chemokine-like protein TAFA-5 [Hippocampus zosterae]|uniref:chemokine-like protein TAFA-5 n=1 Tax=Hippocampus zosterae TaxID=109293 RepID=UPI00223CAE40|nr:chemokine-like protein TAFA-5 [Hippocampus zosterae]